MAKFRRPVGLLKGQSQTSLVIGVVVAILLIGLLGLQLVSLWTAEFGSCTVGALQFSKENSGGGPPSLPDCTPENQAAYQGNPKILEIMCEATPWLLPARSPALSYSGVSGEEELLALRTKPFRQYNKTLSVFGFTRTSAVLTQNCVYTLVRFAGVTNYVAMTWTPEDHAACLDLNLPCWDVTRFLPWGAGGGENGELAHFGSPDYNAICWLRPRVVSYLVDKGYAVHNTDVDVAYSTKPLWESYIRYIEDGGADGAMGQEASGGANGGNYVFLPTPGAKAFLRKWGDAALQFNDTNDQFGLGMLHEATGGQSHVFCWLAGDCANMRQQLGPNEHNTGLIRHYALPWTSTHPDPCFLNTPNNVRDRPIDPCHWTMLYVHPICTLGGSIKIDSIKAAKFWFVDDANLTAPSEGAGAPPPPRLAPLRWRQPRVEDAFWECVATGLYPLALTHTPFENRTAPAAALGDGAAEARGKGGPSGLGSGLELLAWNRRAAKSVASTTCSSSSSGRTKAAAKALKAARAEAEAARKEAELARAEAAAAKAETRAAKAQHEGVTVVLAGEEQQSAQEQPKQDGGPAAPGACPPQEPQLLRPVGYSLPEECQKHQLLYPAIFDLLRPWLVRGISKDDVDACGVAPAPRANFSTGEFTSMGHAARFRLLLWDNEVLVISGGLRREGTLTGLDFFMISQIQDAARRFGLPNMEFVVGWGDLVGIDRKEGEHVCPILAYCKRPETYDILVPDGQFIQHMFDDWVERALTKDPVPWEQKEEKAVGRWHGYCAHVAPTDRQGNKLDCPRQDYMKHWNETKGEFTSFPPEWMPLSEQLKFKYTLSTDGLSCSARLQKVLAAEQTVLKHDSISSPLFEFYYPAMKPWVHYVPVGAEGIQEVDTMVQFLRANDGLARTIARNGQHFAATHLTTEGRLCYLKVLFEEMAKLMRYKSPPPDEFPSHVPFDKEYKTYAKGKPDVDVRPES